MNTKEPKRILKTFWTR